MNGEPKSPDSAVSRFLGIDPPSSRPRIGILPFGYEGTVTYGTGTARGPAALIEASSQVELYDERLGIEPAATGIVTQPQPRIPADPAAAIDLAQSRTGEMLRAGLYPVIIGGEHSISLGVYRALADAYPELGVIQLDAHADLRKLYGNTPYSHACVMARIREHTNSVLQLGIRSLSSDEAQRIRTEAYQVAMMHELRTGSFDLERALQALPEAVFLTFDVDCLDLALIRATGTPEPGGFTWDEIHNLLALIFRKKRVVGFDMVELCDKDRVSAFTAARLLNRMIGLAVSNNYVP